MGFSKIFLIIIQCASIGCHFPEGGENFDRLLDHSGSHFGHPFFAQSQLPDQDIPRHSSNLLPLNDGLTPQGNHAEHTRNSDSSESSHLPGSGVYPPGYPEVCPNVDSHHSYESSPAPSDSSDLLHASNEDGEKTEAFDVSEIPILSFYHMAGITSGFHANFNQKSLNLDTINFGVHAKSPSPGIQNNRNLNTISAAIKASSFGFQLDGVTLVSYLKKLSSKSKFQITSMQGFLTRLCIKNLEFLHAIYLDVDNTEPVQEEVTRMLNWLHDARDKEPSIKKLVSGHLETGHNNSPSMYTVHSKSAKSRSKEISGLEASESRAIIGVLANYYKSTNLIKWRSLFPKDIGFLKLYLQLAGSEINREKPKRLGRHAKHFGYTGLLPWSDSIPEKDVPLRLEYTLFSNDNTLSFMISNHLKKDRDNEHMWKELSEYEYRKAQEHMNLLMMISETSSHQEELTPSKRQKITTPAKRQKINTPSKRQKIINDSTRNSDSSESLHLPGSGVYPPGYPEVHPNVDSHHSYKSSPAPSNSPDFLHASNEDREKTETFDVSEISATTPEPPLLYPGGAWDQLVKAAALMDVGTPAGEPTEETAEESGVQTGNKEVAGIKPKDNEAQVGPVPEMEVDQPRVEGAKAYAKQIKDILIRAQVPANLPVKSPVLPQVTITNAQEITGNVQEESSGASKKRRYKEAIEGIDDWSPKRSTKKNEKVQEIFEKRQLAQIKIAKKMSKLIDQEDFKEFKLLVKELTENLEGVEEDLKKI